MCFLREMKHPNVLMKTGQYNFFHISREITTGDTVNVGWKPGEADTEELKALAEAVRKNI